MNYRNRHATSRLLLRRAAALRKHLPAAVGGDDVGVHQARVATRRLREAVPILATGLKGSRADKAGRKMRRLTRALGGIRELDVTLQLIGEMTGDPDLPRAALEDVRRHLIGERDRRRAVMLERLEAVDIEKLERRLASVAEALEASEVEAWRPVLSARLLSRARRLEQAVTDAGQMYAPDRLHAVRIAAKKLRYGLELAADSGAKGATPLVTRIKRAQNLLGRLHDLQVLQSHVNGMLASGDAAHQDTREALETLARRVEDRCRHLHGKYVVNAGGLYEICDAVRRRIAPEVAKVRVRRPLKMSIARKTASRAAGSGH